MQTPAPALPTATDGRSFDNPVVDTVFPLMLTAVVNSGGDATTTSKGATLSLDASTGAYSLTINNQALGINDANVAFSPPTTLPNGQGLSVSIATLDYTLYGFWDIRDLESWQIPHGATFLTGYATPAGSIPVSGTASYWGKVTGQYWYDYDYYEYLFGDVNLTADFGARSVSGSMTNMSVTSSDVTINGPMNDIGLSATLDPSQNLFVGTTRVTSSGIFNSNAAGAISGRFFGPSAQEVGAVFTLSDSAHRLIGAFGARRVGN